MKTIVIEEGKLGIKDGNKFMPAKGIIMHEKPDIDCAASKWLFELFGISTGKIHFKSAGEDGLVEGKTLEQWLDEGWVLVDIGGNATKRPDPNTVTHLDHHPQSYYPNDCAATLCLKLISPKIEDPILIKIINFVRARDITSSQQFLDLAHVAKIFANKLPSSETMQYVVSGLNAFYQRSVAGKKPDKKLFLEIFNEFAKDKPEIPELMLRYQEKAAEGKTQNILDILSITSWKTQDLVRFVLEETYNDQMGYRKAEKLFDTTKKIPLSANKFLVYQETGNHQFQKVALKNGATIIVLKNKKGQVQIFTQKTDNVNIEDIAAALRFEEKSHDGTKEVLNFAELRKDGISSFAPNWYLFKKGGMLLNGSSTTPNQKPTALESSLIIDIIQKARSDYMPYCKGGRKSCGGEKCKIYGWGLDRCQKARRLNIPSKFNRKKEIVPNAFGNNFSSFFSSLFNSVIKMSGAGSFFAGKAPIYVFIRYSQKFLRRFKCLNKPNIIYFKVFKSRKI